MMKHCLTFALLFLWQPFVADAFSPAYLPRGMLGSSAWLRNPPFAILPFLPTAPSTTTALRATSPFTDEFKTNKGELVNPYSVLKVPRDADTSHIKKSYRELSRRYHPDGNRHRTILPGNCNNAEEVRDHWERIRLSYQILKSPTLRKRYDRHEVMSDPKAALQRAAADAALKSVKSVGQGLFRGIFSAGSFAVEQLTKEKQHPAKESKVDASFVNTSTSSSMDASPTNDAGGASQALSVVGLPSNATNLVLGLVQ
jgi:DnaJ domain